MDNNYRQELVSPETGQTLVVGNPAEAARLKAKGFREPEPEPPAVPPTVVEVQPQPEETKPASAKPRVAKKNEKQDTSTEPA
ncbi:hypothetical protein ACWEOE_10900 [Amycolatopsis sp. NPDC004368]